MSGMRPKIWLRVRIDFRSVGASATCPLPGGLCCPDGLLPGGLCCPDELLPGGLLP
jgi:hypothetical protein